MTEQVRVAPPNSLILVMDLTVGEIPDNMDSGVVSATKSCVAVGTLSESDGQTALLISDERESPTFGANMVFDGIIDTPSRTLCVSSVLGETLVKFAAPGERTRLRIWINDDNEPDDIRIFVSAVR